MNVLVGLKDDMADLVGGGGGGDSKNFDGKRMRNKPLHRRTVDYNASIIRYLDTRIWRGSRRKERLLPRFDLLQIYDMLPPQQYLDVPISSVCTRFVHTSTNKVRCPINVVRWTPDGRRLVTGSTSGEFTIWNGLTFNFETIMQAHDMAIRTMTWTHNDQWLVSADQGGIVKYWQPNLNNLKILQAHREAVRDLTFSPTDMKFATASDDGTIRIWNFNEGVEERVLTGTLSFLEFALTLGSKGHGWDVKCVDWHPYKSLLVSGSKDNLLKLWCPKSGKALTTLHGHKNTILSVKWNRNGNWFASASRDQLVRLYDVRTLKEIQSFRGHKKEVCSVSWHPVHERLFVTGGSDGCILYWMEGVSESVGNVETAHDSHIWSLDWHPLGHILVSGSNDHATRFWTRCRPGEEQRDFKTIENAQTSADEFNMAADDYALPGLSLQPTKKYPAGNANQVPLGDRFGGNNVRNSTQPMNSMIKKEPLKMKPSPLPSSTSSWQPPPPPPPPPGMLGMAPSWAALPPLPPGIASAPPGAAFFQAPSSTLAKRESNR